MLVDISVKYDSNISIQNKHIQALSYIRKIKTKFERVGFEFEISKSHWSEKPLQHPQICSLKRSIKERA